MLYDPSFEENDLQFSNLKCQLHNSNVNYFQIKILDHRTDEDIFFIPKCKNCHNKNFEESQSQFLSYKLVQTLIKIGTYIETIFKQKIQVANELKAEIIKILETKLFRKIKYVSFYSQLLPSNRAFLQNMDQTICRISLSNNQKKLTESKKWIKNPQQFEDKFNLQLTKENLTTSLDTKYQWLKSLQILKKFLQKIGLVYTRSSFHKDLIQCDLSTFNQVIQKIINSKRKYIIQRKIFVLKSIIYMIKTQSKVEDINKYMNKFINLYESIDFWTDTAKFNVVNSHFIDFAFNIQQTTVILKNPNLNIFKTYNSIQYNNQFLFINDGEYVFNNQYRFNAFCQDKMDLQRDQDTMIGNQFFSKPIDPKDSVNYGKIIQINKYLSSKSKICLKLRLNSEQFDKISIRILWSKSFQKFLKDQKDGNVGFNLKIIPDEGQNSKFFGFCKVQQDKLEKKVCQRDPLMVLEDDIINLYLNSQETKVICWNQTQNCLIWQYLISKVTFKLQQNKEITFQSQFYIGIVLYSAIPEIQILKFMKQEQQIQL